MNETDYSRYTVLVVDDVPVNILLVKGMLSKLKFNVISANSGLQALELLQRTRADIILMDIMMPGMNGFEATKAVRANPATSDIPVIILSALNSDSDIKEGLEAGANEFITKPFIQERIVNSIINQISLSESRRNNHQKEGGRTYDSDAAIRLIAYTVCGRADDSSNRLMEMALCLPLPTLDESFYALSNHTEEELSAWAANRMQEMEVKSEQVSVNDCLAHVISLMTPAAAARGIVLKTDLASQLNATADATLLKAVFTNLLSYACRVASGEVTIQGNMDGGLASILITCTTETSADIDFRTALALEAASKMNGAVMCEQDKNGQCRFQVLLQI